MNFTAYPIQLNDRAEMPGCIIVYIPITYRNKSNASFQNDGTGKNKTSCYGDFYDKLFHSHKTDCNFFNCLFNVTGSLIPLDRQCQCLI